MVLCYLTLKIYVNFMWEISIKKFLMKLFQHKIQKRLK